MTAGDGSARAAIEPMLAAVRAQDAAHGDALGSTTAHRALVTAAAASGAQAADAFVKAAIALLVQVTDGSNLTLDPDIDSYYLMDGSLFRLPDLIDQAAALRDLAAATGAAGQASAAQAEQKGGLLAILAYMDVDLSTDLRHLSELVEPLADGIADVVTGSRLAPGAEIRRGWRREVLSRVYNRLARAMTGSRVMDHQCGFKALTLEAARDLLDHVENQRWFFDTELLVAAQRRGWRVWELPIRWVDDPGSTVRILPTVVEDLCGLWRLRRWKRGAAGPGDHRRGSRTAVSDHGGGQ